MNSLVEYLSHFEQDHGLLVYGVLSLISIPFGPSVTLPCGFLCRQGLLDWDLTIPIILGGNIIGDSLHYVIGICLRPLLLRFWRNRVGTLNGYSHKHVRALCIASKLIHGIGNLGLFAAGIFRVGYFRFVLYCTEVSLLQTAVLLGLGYLFGSAYSRIVHYLNIYAAAGSVAVMILITVILFRHYRKHLLGTISPPTTD